MLLVPAQAKDISSAAMSPSPISVRDLTVAYAGRPALIDVTWSSPASALLAIVGPNGAGKTTLIKAILGLVSKASGEVLIYGKPLDAQRGKVAYVPQRSSVDWDFPASALDVVAMGLYRRIGWLRPARRIHSDEAREHLRTVGLEDFADRQIGALSGGQQQRVFLARALAQRASIFLLDEPFAGVDATTEKIMIDVFRRLRAEGALIICVHHDLASVPDTFDHVMLLNQRLIAAGPTEVTFTPELVARTYGVPLATGAQARQ